MRNDEEMTKMFRAEDREHIEMFEGKKAKELLPEYKNEIDKGKLVIRINTKKK